MPERPEPSMNSLYAMPERHALNSLYDMPKRLASKVNITCRNAMPSALLSILHAMPCSLLDLNYKTPLCMISMPCRKDMPSIV